VVRLTERTAVQVALPVDDAGSRRAEDAQCRERADGSEEHGANELFAVPLPATTSRIATLNPAAPEATATQVASPATASTVIPPTDAAVGGRVAPRDDKDPACTIGLAFIASACAC
jgi:hypothetical protein